MQFIYTSVFRVLTFIVIVSLFSSCVSHEELISFNSEQALPADTDIMNKIDLRIQADDLLKIDIHSFNLEAAAPFNLEKGGGSSNLMQNTENLELFTGYLVDEEGMITLPVLGDINLDSLTLVQAKEKISNLVKPYLKDAVVNIRFLNFKITISGEVNAPGTIRLTNKRVTLLEAIGKAGDLTFYANRTNILLAREENGIRTYHRLDLTNYDVFQSPYFYLKQNDFIYVEPIKARVATVADPAQRIFAYSSGILSIISIILALTL